MGRNKLEKE